ncbi:MAG: acetylglutamate kinase [Actinomycetota bacterium]|nr:acetylglutamate kinase [Actinomycetota bacterium]
MENALTKAEILMEALPYIKEYYGRTITVKYGGSAMLDDSLKQSIASDIVLMRYVGMNPVIVHGGGPEISSYMKKLKKEVKFVEGLRVTDKETMDIVKMVLVGKVNKELVSMINCHARLPEPGGQGRIAVGISGDDAGLIIAQKCTTTTGQDLGFAGEVQRINTEILQNLIKDGFTPVIASVGVGEEGESYNINADSVAAEIAAALKADKIIFLTNVDGLYKDFADKKSLISALNIDECERLIKENLIGEGMLPKVRGCIRALKAGVKRAHILNGTIPHALLLEIFTDEGIGTMITA